VKENVFPGIVKWPELEGDRSLQSDAELKNEWSCISALLLYGSMLWTGRTF
jgi:hypothetical protein